MHCLQVTSSNNNNNGNSNKAEMGLRELPRSSLTSYLLIGAVIVLVLFIITAVSTLGHGDHLVAHPAAPTDLGLQQRNLHAEEAGTSRVEVLLGVR